MDPLDSDLIINEQCMNLTATYNLPQVKDVMLRSELELVVKNLMGKKHLNTKMSKIIK
jgi:hypothetical protein